MATDAIGVLTAALDEAVAVEPTVLGDGEAVVALHRQLERLQAVVTRAVAAFDAGGTGRPTGPAPRRRGWPRRAASPSRRCGGGCTWAGSCAT